MADPSRAAQPLLDLKRLRIFEAVAVRGSFQAAAEALSYTGPAISHHVAQLELEIGTRLITRRGPGPHLTPAGELLLVRTRDILAAVSDAELALSELTDGRARVRVGAFETASVTLVADVIVAVQDAQPGIRLGLVEGEPPETLERLRRREIDVGVIFESSNCTLPSNDELEYEYLGIDPLVVVLSKQHPLARRPGLRLRDLCDEQWIEGARPDSPLSLCLTEACVRASFEPRVAFNTGNVHLALRLVADGLGVALAPQIAVTSTQDVVVRRLPDSLPVRRVAVALRRARRERPRPLADVIDALRSGASKWLSPMETTEPAMIAQLAAPVA